MKTLTESLKSSLQTLLETTKEDFNNILPTWCDVVKLSPEKENIEFLTIDEIKKNSSLSKVLKLKYCQSIVIDNEVYVMLIDISALDEK